MAGYVSPTLVMTAWLCCVQVLSEALGWIVTAVDDFGVAMLDVRHIISWCIADLESRDAAVRSAVRA